MAKADSTGGQNLGLAAHSGHQSSDDAALARFKEVRWQHGAFCPHCGSSQIYHFSDHHTYKCGQCRKRFSAKVGTIFEDTKVGLASWFVAVQLATETPRGVTPTELAQRIGVSQKTAVHMLNRLRQAAQTASFNQALEPALPTSASPSKPSIPRTGEVVA